MRSEGKVLVISCLELSTFCNETECALLGEVLQLTWILIE